MGKNVMEELVSYTYCFITSTEILSQVLSSIADFLEHLDKLPDKTNVDMYWPIQVLTIRG